MHDADDAAFDVDGHAQHRADALLPEDRVYDVGVVEVDDDRSCLSGDAARETACERHLDALADLLLQPSRGTCDEDAAILVEQQHRRCVDLERVADALQQLGEHVLERHVPERRVGDAEQMATAALRDGGTERGTLGRRGGGMWRIPPLRLRSLSPHGGSYTRQTETNRLLPARYRAVIR